MGERYTTQFEQSPRQETQPELPAPVREVPAPRPEPARSEAPEAPSASLSPEEQEHKDSLRQEVTKGLAALYEMLPRQGTVKASEVKTALPLTESRLVELTPLMKNTLSEIIEEQALHLKPKVEFIKAGLVVLELWLHMQALGDAATERLGQLQAEFRAIRGEKPAAEGKEKPLPEEG